MADWGVRSSYWAMGRKRLDKSTTVTQPNITPAWPPLARVAFRFSFVYLGLFCLATQISGSMIPNLSFYYRGLGRLWPMRDVTFWISEHVFGTPVRLDDALSNGEPLFFWVQTFWLLIAAVLVTAV